LITGSFCSCRSAFYWLRLPFFCSGLAISLLLVRGASQINRLYCYDLLGAGLGCGLIGLVIPQFGGSGSVLFAAFVGTAVAARGSVAVPQTAN
jgi:hypothetical protein